LSEITSRAKSLQAHMEGLFGVLILQNTDLCYFSGTAQDGVLFIPAQGEPTLLVRKSLERAKEESPLPDVRPLGSLKELGSALKLPSGAAIGMELDVVPYNTFHRYAQALPGCPLADVSEQIKLVRSVKSRFEIGLIRKAAAILDAGIASAQEHAKPGMREVELAAKMELTMRSIGHQGLMRFRRWNHDLYYGNLMSGPDAAAPSFLASPTGGRGVTATVPHGSGFRKIRRNEPILIDYVGAYNGYMADETRVLCIGRLSREFEDAYQTSLQIEKAVAKALRPGNTARAVYEMSERMGSELGYGDKLGGPPGRKCGFVGHGVGMEVDEYPVLASVDQRIEAGNVVAVEPKMTFPGKGVVGIEDTFLVTVGGAKRLTKLDQGIWYV